MSVIFVHKFFSKNVSGYSVAIITPTTHPALEKIEHGFVETFNKLTSQRNVYKTYNAHGRRSLLKAQIEQVVNGSYDLIFTIAASPTLMTNEIARKRKCDIPQIFAAVSQPKNHGIRQDRMVTGIAEAYNPQLQIEALRYFKPDLKGVLIVYAPTETPELQNDAEMVKKILETHNIKARKIEIFNIVELAQRVTPLLYEFDTILVLIDNTVVSGIDALITLCKRHHITLVASDLDSGLKGAALSTGVKEECYGIKAAQQAFDVLVQKKLASEIPFMPLDDHYVQVNTRTMKEQHLSAEQKLSSLPKVFQEKGCVCVKLS